jgi:hypothetical protein
VIFLHFSSLTSYFVLHYSLSSSNIGLFLFFKWVLFLLSQGLYMCAAQLQFFNLLNTITHLHTLSYFFPFLVQQVFQHHCFEEASPIQRCYVHAGCTSHKSTWLWSSDWWNPVILYPSAPISWHRILGHLSSIFWDNVSLCRSDWPQTCDPTALASPALGLQTSTNTSGFPFNSAHFLKGMVLASWQLWTFYVPRLVQTSLQYFLLPKCHVFSFIILAIIAILHLTIYIGYLISICPSRP